MVEKVSTMEVRARIGDMLNRVALRHDEFIIARKGKPLAALVPIERIEQMRRFARLHARTYMSAQLAGRGEELTEDEAMKIALDEQKAARRTIRAAAARPRDVREK